VLIVAIAMLLAAPRAPRPAVPAQESVQPLQLTDEQLRDRVEAYLGGIDRPVSAARWKALGPRAAPLLEAVIADGTQFPSRRAQAVDGLVATSPDRAASLVGKLARDEKQPVIVRVAAMHGASQVLPPSQTLTELRPVLRSSKSTGLRAEAADVMARKQGGCAEVRDQVARETVERRGAFVRAIKRCGE
jgi:hypothetical protein